MKSVPNDDSLRVPEPPENGLAFLEQTECEDGSSPEAILYSSDHQYIPDKRTSEPKRFNQKEIKISFEPLLCLKRNQNSLLLYWRKEILF
jgi:hypothetical protein